MSAIQEVQGTFHVEIRLENEYLPIALTLDIDQLMTGCGYRNFTTRYTKFSSTNPTPNLLCEGEQHARQFVDQYGYEGDFAAGAVIYALSRVWKAKAESSTILRQDIQRKYQEIEQARKSRVELHVAVNRLAKNKSEDSFEAGLKVNVTGLLHDAGAAQLAALTSPVEVKK